MSGGEEVEPLALLRTNGVIYELENPETTVGRNPDCDIVLRGSRSISSFHAKVVVENVARRKAKLVDIGSLNGCFVNEGRVQGTSVPLRSGDMIKFGYDTASYRFEFAADSKPAVEPDMSKVPPHLRRSVEPPKSFKQQAARAVSDDVNMRPDRSRSPSKVRRRETTGAGEMASRGLGSHYAPSRGRSRSKSTGRPGSAAAASGSRSASRGRAGRSGSRQRPASAKPRSVKSSTAPAKRKSKQAAGPRTSLKSRMSKSGGGKKRGGEFSTMAHTATGRRDVSQSPPPRRRAAAKSEGKGKGKGKGRSGGKRSEGEDDAGSEVDGWDAEHSGRPSSSASSKAEEGHEDYTGLFDAALLDDDDDEDGGGDRALPSMGDEEVGGGEAKAAAAGAGIGMMAALDEEDDEGGDYSRPSPSPSPTPRSRQQVKGGSAVTGEVMFAGPPSGGRQQLSRQGTPKALHGSHHGDFSEAMVMMGPASSSGDGNGQGQVVGAGTPSSGSGLLDATLVQDIESTMQGAGAVGGGSSETTRRQGQGKMTNSSLGTAASSSSSSKQQQHSQGEAAGQQQQQQHQQVVAGSQSEHKASEHKEQGYAEVDTQLLKQQAAAEAERQVALAHSQMRVQELEKALEQLSAAVDAKDAALKESISAAQAASKKFVSSLQAKERDLQQLRDVHKSTIEQMSATTARKDLELKQLRLRHEQETKRLKASAELKTQQLSDVKAMQSSQAHAASLMALQRWADHRQANSVRNAWSRWTQAAFTRQIEATATRERAMADALKEASGKLELLMTNDWARELVQQQEQIQALQAELVDAEERNHRERLAYASAAAGVTGTSLAAPGMAGAGPGLEEYPAALHPESSAHTQRLVEAAVQDAVSVAQAEWRHERERLAAALADRDRQVFRMARAVAQVAQQGADTKRQEAAKLLVSELQRLQEADRRRVEGGGERRGSGSGSRSRHRGHDGGASSARSRPSSARYGSTATSHHYK